jgi:hypothetical protein
MVDSLGRTALHLAAAAGAVEAVSALLNTTERRKLVQIKDTKNATAFDYVEVSINSLALLLKPLVDIRTASVLLK